MQLVENCRSNRIRRKAFRDDPNLEDLMKYVRALKISDHHSSELEKQHRQETVYHTASQEHQPNRTRKASRVCYNCGGTYPHQTNPCLAIGKICNICSKTRHFARVCKSKSTSTSPGQITKDIKELSIFKRFERFTAKAGTAKSASEFTGTT